MENNSYKFDVKALINLMTNAELLKEEKIKPVIEVCNKYGIYGLQTIEFLMELSFATQQIDTDNE